MPNPRGNKRISAAAAVVGGAYWVRRYVGLLGEKIEECASIGHDILDVDAAQESALELLRLQ